MNRTPHYQRREMQIASWETQCALAQAEVIMTSAYCSFCGIAKDNLDLTKFEVLIEVQDSKNKNPVCICSNCVNTCLNIINNHRKEKAPLVELPSLTHVLQRFEVSIDPFYL